MIVLRDSIYASCIWTYLTVNKQGWAQIHDW
jgi:hypothetical protein